MLVVTWLLTITYYALGASAIIRNSAREPRPSQPDMATAQPTRPTPRAVTYAETTGACPSCRRPVGISGFVRQVGCSFACTLFSGHDVKTHEAYGADHRVLPALVGRVQTGPLVVDGGLRQAFLGPHTLGLSGREYQLLAVLAGSLGRTCRREDVARALYPSAIRGGEAELHLIAVMLSRLTRRLGIAGALIERVLYQGLRLRDDPPYDYCGPPPADLAHAQPWSTRAAACRSCGRTDSPHKSRGRCASCCAREYRARQRKERPR